MHEGTAAETERAPDTRAHAVTGPFLTSAEYAAQANALTEALDAAAGVLASAAAAPAAEKAVRAALKAVERAGACLSSGDASFDLPEEGDVVIEIDPAEFGDENLADLFDACLPASNGGYVVHQVPRFFRVIVYLYLFILFYFVLVCQDVLLLPEILLDVREQFANTANKVPRLLFWFFRQQETDSCLGLPHCAFAGTARSFPGSSARAQRGCGQDPCHVACGARISAYQSVAPGSPAGEGEWRQRRVFFLYTKCSNWPSNRRWGCGC
jgi:hypothetical protein